MDTELPWIISAARAEELTGPDAAAPARLADVRWYLDGRSGLAAYEAGHLPGAAFVDLDRVLASAPSPEEGRHPLPVPETFAAGMEIAGITDDTPVIAYDDAGGASASRLVWLLRATGHRAALLDGGLQAWTARHGQDALETGPDPVEPAPEGSFTPDVVDTAWLADIDQVQAAASSGTTVVVDSRAPERYRGETEPMDPRAGHVPGAVNVFHRDHLGQDGSFLPEAALLRRWAEAGVLPAADGAVEDGEVPEAEAERAAGPIVYCGSGVTACHNLVVLESLGIPARLYPGSWSQYAGTDRPMA